MPINVNELAAGLSEWGGEIVARVAESKISVVRMSATGAASDFDIHPHDEAILVISGGITIDVQSVLIELGPGDFTEIKAGQRHRVVGSLGGTLMLFERSLVDKPGDC